MKKKRLRLIVYIGPSGLAVAKNLLEVGEDFDITIYEKRSSVGGVWAYSDDERITSTLKGESTPRYLF